MIEINEIENYIDKYPMGVYNKGEFGGKDMDCCKKKKNRTQDERKALINRLKRIEGQVRGVSGMVESDVYCVDILNQVAAISAALSAFSRELLESHIKSCVAEELISGGTEKTNELSELLRKLIK